MRQSWVPILVTPFPPAPNPWCPLSSSMCQSWVPDLVTTSPPPSWALMHAYGGPWASTLWPKWSNPICSEWFWGQLLICEYQVQCIGGYAAAEKLVRMTGE